MAMLAALRLPDPPDLLRRFAPAPYQAFVSFEGHPCRIRTNDACILQALIQCSQPHESDACELEWTLISDPAMPKLLENPIVMEGQPVLYLRFGRACFVAIDRQRKEIASFISAGVAMEAITDLVVPTILNLLKR